MSLTADPSASPGAGSIASHGAGCQDLRELVALGSRDNSRHLTQHDVDDWVARAQATRDASPPELADDWNQSIAWLSASMQEAVDRSAAARDRALNLLRAPKTKQANDRLQAWATSTCGINLGLTGWGQAPASGPSTTR